MWGGQKRERHTTHHQHTHTESSLLPSEDGGGGAGDGQSVNKHLTRDGSCLCLSPVRSKHPSGEPALRLLILPRD